ncbi:hypothetical protein N0V88_005725 [Collariella sp. IMI 366227]|nr:hypothetical protein N0V88_005725 [Collariella sp. IMI 366227]
MTNNTDVVWGDKLMGWPILHILDCHETELIVVDFARVEATQYKQIKNRHTQLREQARAAKAGNKFKAVSKGALIGLFHNLRYFTSQPALVAPNYLEPLPNSDLLPNSDQSLQSEQLPKPEQLLEGNKPSEPDGASDPKQHESPESEVEIGPSRAEAQGSQYQPMPGRLLHAENMKYETDSEEDDSEDDDSE